MSMDDDAFRPTGKRDRLARMLRVVTVLRGHPDGIRPSEAPMLVGNLFDPRSLTQFGGQLRVGFEVDRNPYYAFEGLIDELRLSNVARTEFPYVR